MDVSADARTHEKPTGRPYCRGTRSVAGSASCPLSVAAHSTGYSRRAFPSIWDGRGTARSWYHAGASPFGVRRAVCPATRAGLEATSHEGRGQTGIVRFEDVTPWQAGSSVDFSIDHGTGAGNS